MMIRFALWLATFCGWKGCEKAHLPDNAFVESAKKVCARLKNVDGSGEYKRAQALRSLMQIHPEARERDLALAIEIICQDL